MYYKHLNESQNHILMIYGINLILHLNLGPTINHRSSGMISGLSSKTAGSTTKTRSWPWESSATCSGASLTTSITIGFKSRRRGSRQALQIRSLPALRIKVPNICLLRHRFLNFNNRRTKIIDQMCLSHKLNRQKPLKRHLRVKPRQ